MSWGFVSPWAKEPIKRSIPRPFNARSETVSKKNYLKVVGKTKDV